MAQEYRAVGADNNGVAFIFRGDVIRKRADGKQDSFRNRYQNGDEVRTGA